MSSAPAPAPAQVPTRDAISESQRIRDEMDELGLSFENYKRGVRRQAYIEAPSPARANVSASEYLRRRFGDFSGATTIETPQQSIVGTKQLTLGDLKYIQKNIKSTISQLIQTRSVFLPIQTKQTQLEQISSDLDNIIGAVERNEIPLEEVPIDIRAAQTFLDSFRRMDVMPPLIGTRRVRTGAVSPSGPDYENEGIVFGPSGSLLAPSGSPAAAPSGSPAAAPSAESERARREAEAKQLIYDNIQYAKWSADMNMDPRINEHKEIKRRLKDMDERMYMYATSETPLPADIYATFTQELARIYQTLEKT